MHRPILVALVGLLLAACDTGGPDEPNGIDPTAIIGLWAIDQSESSTFVTVTEAQDIPDLSLPAETALTLSGAVDASLNTVQAFSYRGPDGISLDVTDSATPPSLTLEMLLDPVAGAFFDLSITPDFNQYGGQFDDLTPFTYDRLGVGIDAVTLDANRAPPGQVVIDGRLSFATRRAVAGGDFEIHGPHAGSGRAEGFDNAESARFDADGTLTLTFPAPGEVRAGRWEVTGDSLMLALDATDSEDGVRATFRAFTPEGALLLTRTDRSGGDDASEHRYLVEPGTLAGVGREVNVNLSR